jgi:DHA1 family bicyclomycin/chloramphenicol resistance-like MFS transporter
MMMALTSVAIDLMLPAFDDIRAYFGLPPEATQVAQIVTTFFLGMALAQYFYGPFADRFGRKPVLYAGLGIYALGALGALLAPSLSLVLVFRFIWGVGAAGPRMVTTSMVRDYYSGDQMARTMSYIMAVFIMVPVVSPTIGAGLISVLPWQSVFAFCLVFAAVIGIWATLVLPETLDPVDRRPIDGRAIWATTREVLTNRTTIGYTIAMTMTFSVFVSYLASSELIFGGFYGKADQFPFIFGAIAVVMGMAMLTNARLVQRVGTRRLTHIVAIGYVVAAALITTVTLAAGGRLSFWPFVGSLAILIVFHAVLMPNLNTIAMLPMGRIAGTASAVIGTVSMGGGAFFGAIINGMYTDSALPLIVAFLVFGILTLVAVAWAEHGRLIVATADSITTLGDHGAASVAGATEEDASWPPRI